MSNHMKLAGLGALGASLFASLPAEFARDARIQFCGPAGTDAVEINSALGGGIRVTSHSTPSAVVEVSDQGDIVTNEVLVICNMDYAFVFQVTGLPSTNQLQHNSGTSLNCAQEFQYDEPCTGTGASGAFGYCFVPGATPSAQCVGSSNSPALAEGCAAKRCRSAMITAGAA